MGYYDGYLYIAGGAFENSSTSIADFFRFNLDSLQWEDISRTQTYDPVILSDSVIYNGHFYLFFGWSNFASDDSSKVYRVNLQGNFDWEEVASYPELKRDSFACEIVDSVVYIFSGYSMGSVDNQMITIDLSSISMEYTVTNDLATPALRVFHTIEAINDTLLLFGGESNEVKMNDLWEFNTQTEIWESIISMGSIPSPRSHHSSSSLGDTMIIWGGISNSGYMNDMYKYSVKSNTWEELTYESRIAPTPRVSACVVLVNPLVYIYGGKTESGLSSELWQYEIDSKEYTLLSTDAENSPGFVQKHKCFVKDSRLYVAFGTSYADLAKGQVHYFDLIAEEWTHLTTSTVKRNGAIVQNIDDKILIAGGETWGSNLFTDMFYIDLNLCKDGMCEEHEIGQMSDYFINGASAYSQQFLYAHGGSSPLNNIHRAIVAKNAFFKIDLFENCPSCNLQCALGSINQQGSCEFCPEGWYSEIYGGECLPCSEGFYNDRKGSRSHHECFPCPNGMFNPSIGANYCLICPAHASCSIGSKSYYYGENQQEETSIQPNFYESRSSEASELTLYLIILFIILGFLVFSLLMIWREFHKYLIQIDLFERLHTHRLGMIVVLKKNRMGGSFSLIFYTLACILIASTVPSYMIDNVIETKTLVPYIIVSEDYEFFSTINVELTLDNYFAPCEESITQCATSIQFSTEYLNTRSGIVQTCHTIENQCRILLECAECSIEGTALVNFELSDSISYSSGVTVNITAFSSIPGDFSTVRYSIYAPEETVFRGSPASVFYYSMVSSVYKNSISSDEKTGYHVLMYKNPSYGASYTTFDVPFSSDLNVQIELSRSENSLITLHDEKNSILLLAIALIGSISGALGAIGAGMSTFEKFYERLKDRIELSKNNKELKENRRQYKIFLSNNYSKTEVVEFDDESKEKPDIFPGAIYSNKTELEVDNIN